MANEAYVETYGNTGDKKPMAIVRQSDGASIPLDPGNIDYQAYLVWKAVVTNIPGSRAVNPVPTAALAGTVKGLTG